MIEVHVLEFIQETKKKRTDKIDYHGIWVNTVNIYIEKRMSVINSQMIWNVFLI